MSRTNQSDSLTGLILRLVIVGLFDAGAIWFISGLISDGVIWLTLAFVFVTIFINVVFFFERFYPIRWMAMGLALMMLLAIYPMLFTIYVAFTNYGDGHILTRVQAIEQLEQVQYLPEESGVTYSWTAYTNEAKEYVLWLERADGATFLGKPAEALIPATPDTNGFGQADDDGIPVSFEGYERLNRIQTVSLINDLGAIEFGIKPDNVKIRSLDEAASLQQRYTYDETLDTLTDLETGLVYKPIDGTFTAEDGSTLTPGYSVPIGLENFQRFFRSSAIQGPLIRVVLWNFAFAFLSVTTTFALGLAIALLFEDLPGKKIIRTFLLIPYTIPSLITILVWRGLLNPDLGIISTTIESVIGYSIPWFSDQIWAKVGILLINLWLGYPYFMLVCSGALQAIPRDIYSAAEVDGASPWQQFVRLTLPLLLVAVGPLLVASFTFNFNNFNVIYLYNNGGPPIIDSATPAGHTDILVSYVYRLAFAGGRGTDYGFASAITIIIFIVVGAITLFQFRYTQMWEEVGEGV